MLVTGKSLYKVCYSRYQILFYFWHIRSAVKDSYEPQNHEQARLTNSLARKVFNMTKISENVLILVQNRNLYKKPPPIKVESFLSYSMA